MAAWYNKGMQKYDLQIVRIKPDLAKQLTTVGWLFDWSIDNSDSSIKVGAFYDDNLQGLIEFAAVPEELHCVVYTLENAPFNVGKTKQHTGVAGTLLAYVANESFKLGFNGFVLLETKTILAKHYVEKYGAKQIGRSQRLYFDTIASRNLIKTFLEG
jgi:hypothetical protein